MKFIRISFIWFLLGLSDSTKVPSNVIELNENFLEHKDAGNWLVEFFAPWCAHCKRLQPIWEQVGHALADMDIGVRVAKLDCTRYNSVAQIFGIRGYPTILFFRQGKVIPYEGERRKEDIIQFTEKSAGPVITRIESSQRFQEILSDQEPSFILIRSNMSQDDELFSKFENVSEALFTEVRFYEITTNALPKSYDFQKTSIIVAKDSDYIEFDPIKDDNLHRWVGEERWALLPKVTASNIHAIAESSGKKLVLALVHSIDRLNTSTESGRFLQTMKEVAIESKKNEELKNNFQFGWTIDSSMANSIVMEELPIPSTFVFNLSSYEYYMSNDDPGQVTANSLILFLKDVATNIVLPKGGRSWITRLKRMYYDTKTNLYDMFYNQPILTMCLFGVPLAFFGIIIYSICSADFSVDRDEIYPEDDSGEDDYISSPQEESDHEKAE